MPSSDQDAILSEHDIDVVGGESALPRSTAGSQQMIATRSYGSSSPTWLCPTRADVEVAVPAASEFAHCKRRVRRG